MRYILVFLLLASITAAADYTMYSPSSIMVDGNNVSFFLAFGSRAGLDLAVVQYSRALDGTDTTAISQAKNNTLTQLAAAKRDDTLIISSPWKNFTLQYQQCARMANYSICFTRSTYYEEESDPLGTGALSTVKIVNGTINIPFIVSVDTYKSIVTLTRTVSPTTAYTGEQINVTLTATNTGNGASEPVFIEDKPPFTIRTGTASLDEASISPGKTVTKTYTMLAGEPGVYNITGATSDTLQPKLLTVLSPIAMAINTKDVFAGDDAPFSITINNTYNQDITVYTLTVNSEAKFTTQLEGPGTQAASPGERRLVKFTLAKGTNMVINGTLNPTTPGSYSIDARLSYATSDNNVLTKSAQFQVQAREFVVNLTTNNLTAKLTLLNNELADIKDVVVQFSPEQTARYPVIRQGETKTASFTYPGSANATIFLTYTDSQPHSRSFNFLVTGETSNQQTTPGTVINSSQPPPPATQPTPPTTQPAQPETPPVETPKKSFIKRFLDWLASIFG